MAGSSFQLNGYEKAYFSAFYLHFTFFYFSRNVDIFFFPYILDRDHSVCYHVTQYMEREVA